MREGGQRENSVSRSIEVDEQVDVRGGVLLAAGRRAEYAHIAYSSLTRSVADLLRAASQVGQHLTAGGGSWSDNNLER